MVKSESTLVSPKWLFRVAVANVILKSHLGEAEVDSHIYIYIYKVSKVGDLNGG